MVALSALWLPILVAAVVTFVLSVILWTAPFWHGRDYGRPASEAALLSAMNELAPGQYMVPWFGGASKEDQAKMMSGPTALIMLRNPGSTFSLGRALTGNFLYHLVIAIQVGYVAGLAMGPDAHYMHVFRVVGAVTILAHSFTSVTDSIWYGKPWSITIRTIIDGVIFGLMAAGVFGWLWPR